MGGALLMPLWEKGLIPTIFLENTLADRQVIVKLLILLDELLAEHAIVPSSTFATGHPRRQASR